jgi:hypothetical protein
MGCSGYVNRGGCPFLSVSTNSHRGSGDVHRLNDLSAYSGFKAVLTNAYTG